MTGATPSATVSPSPTPSPPPPTSNELGLGGDIPRGRNRTLSVEEDKHHRKQASKQLVLAGDYELASKVLKQNSSSKNHGQYDEDKKTLEKEAKEDAIGEKKFHNLASKHDGTKPLLILDVDNTMLFVRFFSDEMKVGDTLTYFENDEVERNNARVTEIRLTMTLEVDNDELLEQLGSEVIQHYHFISDHKIVK